MTQNGDFDIWDFYFQEDGSNDNSESYNDDDAVTKVLPAVPHTSATSSDKNVVSAEWRKMSGSRNYYGVLRDVLISATAIVGLVFLVQQGVKLKDAIQESNSSKTTSVVETTIAIQDCRTLVYEPLSIGDNGSSVSCLEKTLLSYGYNPGSEDGLFDEDLTNAVKELQKDTGHTPDGIFGKATAPEIGFENVG